jgi:hypothetical protein
MNVINFLKEQISVRNNKSPFFFFHTWDTYLDRMLCRKTNNREKQQNVFFPYLEWYVERTNKREKRQNTFLPCVGYLIEW